MRELRSRHIVIGAFGAAAAHAAAAVWAVSAVPPQGAVAAGSGGLNVGLSTAGGAPGTAGSVAAAMTETLGPATLSETGKVVATADLIEAQEVAALLEPVPAATRTTPAEKWPAETAPVLSKPPVMETAPRVVRLKEMTAPSVDAAAAQRVDVVETPIPFPPTTPKPVEARTAPATAVEVVEAQPAQVAAPIDLASLTPADAVVATKPAVEPTDNAAAVPVPPVRPRSRERARATPRAQTAPQTQKAAAAEPPEPARTTAKPKAHQDKQAEPSSGEASQAAADAGDSPVDTATAASGGGSGAENGNSVAREGGGDPGARQRYLARVSQILAREQRYPRRARHRRLEGVGRLFFVIEADGRLGARRLRTSTGHDILDKEVLALLDRVGRLPPIPSELGVARLEIDVPIGFTLR